MKNIYIQSLFILLALLISSFSYTQNKAKNSSKTFKQEMLNVAEAHTKSEIVKAISTELTRAAMDKNNRAIVSKATQELWKSVKHMSKKQTKDFLSRLSKMSSSNLSKLAKMSPRQLNSFAASAVGKLSKNTKALRNIIAGAGDKAGNAALQAASKIDNVIARGGKVSKELAKKLKDAANNLPPGRARAFLDYLKNKSVTDWKNITDLETPGKGPGGIVGTVVDGVFVLYDAYDIYYSDDEPEIKAINATSKGIGYVTGTVGTVLAGAAIDATITAAGGFLPGLVIAFTADRVSTLYTEIAMLQKEREAVKDAVKNEKIDNGILVRRQLLNISQKIKSGQVKNAKFLLIKLEKFIVNNNIENEKKIYDLHSELEKDAENAERNQRINEVLNNARHPYQKAIIWYKKGVQLNLAKILANEALVILNNNLKKYPEIGTLKAISLVKTLINSIDKKIANATNFIITGAAAPKKVYAGQFIDIPVFVNGGIPYYSAFGTISGNISDDTEVTMFWQAPSEIGKQNLTFMIRDCMGSVASTSVSIEVVEKIEDNEEFEGNNPLDGLWEINLNSDVINTRINPEDNKAIYKVSKFRELNKNTKNLWGDNSNIAMDEVLKFFNSKKVYFKKIKTLDNGFSYFYLYKYDEDTFEQIVLREIDKSNFEIFPISKYEATNYRLILSVKKNYMECLLEDTGTYMSSYKYKFFRKNTPKNPPTLSNGAWSWNELEDDFKDELKIYSKLSSTEKNNFDLSKIEEDDDAYETIHWKIAVFKKFQSQYNNSISSYKGKRPSTIKKEDLIWELVDIDFVNLGSSPPYSITSSVEGGWVKVWKERVENVEGENYIPPINSEEDPNTKRTKTIVAEFSWSPPVKQYQVSQKWNTNFRKKGNLKATLQTLDNYKVISNNSIEFNSDTNSKEVILNCKYFYNLEVDYEIYEEFRIVYKFESHIK